MLYPCQKMSLLQCSDKCQSEWIGRKFWWPGSVEKALMLSRFWTYKAKMTRTSEHMCCNSYWRTLWKATSSVLVSLFWYIAKNYIKISMSRFRYMHIAWMDLGTGLRAKLQIFPFVENFCSLVIFKNKTKCNSFIEFHGFHATPYFWSLFRL